MKKSGTIGHFTPPLLQCSCLAGCIYSANAIMHDSTVIILLDILLYLATKISRGATYTNTFPR